MRFLLFFVFSFFAFAGYPEDCPLPKNSTTVLIKEVFGFSSQYYPPVHSLDCDGNGYQDTIETCVGDANDHGGCQRDYVIKVYRYVSGTCSDGSSMDENGVCVDDTECDIGYIRDDTGTCVDDGCEGDLAVVGNNGCLEPCPNIDAIIRNTQPMCYCSDGDLPYPTNNPFSIWKCLPDGDDGNETIPPPIENNETENPDTNTTDPTDPDTDPTDPDGSTTSTENNSTENNETDPDGTDPIDPDTTDPTDATIENNETENPDTNTTEPIDPTENNGTDTETNSILNDLKESLSGEGAIVSSIHDSRDSINSSLSNLATLISDSTAQNTNDLANVSQHIDDASVKNEELLTDIKDSLDDLDDIPAEANDDEDFSEQVEQTSGELSSTIKQQFSNYSPAVTFNAPTGTCVDPIISIPKLGVHVPIPVSKHVSNLSVVSPILYFIAVVGAVALVLSGGGM